MGDVLPTDAAAHMASSMMMASDVTLLDLSLVLPRLRLPEPHSFLVLLITACALAAMTALMRGRRSLPPVRCGLFEVLKNYKPGKIYDWHLACALRAGTGRCCERVPSPLRCTCSLHTNSGGHLLTPPAHTTLPIPHLRCRQGRSSCLTTRGSLEPPTRPSCSTSSLASS
eukprot:373597-Prymnesium_polylepis.1